jgi:hypothetical protein
MVTVFFLHLKRCPYDAVKHLTCTNSSAITISIPLDQAWLFRRHRIEITMYGAGSVTIAGDLA